MREEELNSRRVFWKIISGIAGLIATWFFLQPPMLRSEPAGNGPSYALDVAADGTWFAYSKGHQIRIEPCSTNPNDGSTHLQAFAIENAHQDLCYSLAIHPDSALIASGSLNDVKIWQLVRSTEAKEWSAKQLVRIDQRFGSWMTDRVNALAFSPDGEFLAIGSGLASQSGHLTVFSMAKMKGSLSAFDELDEATEKSAIESAIVWQSTVGHSDAILCLAFAPDGRQLASGSADRMIRVWSIDRPDSFQTLEGHAHHVLSLAWSEKEKKIISAGADGAIKIWDIQEGRAVKSLNIGREITDLSLILGSDRFVSSSLDRTVRLHDLRSEQVVRSYSVANDSLYSVGVSSKTQEIIAVGEEGLVYRWKIEP
jgi:WD40 repeat protein